MIFSFCYRFSGLLISAISLSLCMAAPFVSKEYKHLETTSSGDIIFSLGNVNYLANVRHPTFVIGNDYVVEGIEASRSVTPSTVIIARTDRITSSYLNDTITSYIESDDVYNENFLAGLYIIPAPGFDPVLDSSALDFCIQARVSKLVLDKSLWRFSSMISGDIVVTFVEPSDHHALTPGPYAVSFTTQNSAFLPVYRLYPDTNRAFLFGAYDSNDGAGTHTALSTFVPETWEPMIPVPSRIYYWNDERSLAGGRVAVKDLFDVKGLQTSAGSLAWAKITPIANDTAPSMQRILDLGGVLIGKYKLAQFASGADPWEWQDSHYPWNPRGDEYLTCSASSSGGGCAVAAYDWLDFAIGSDTGSSMRRPAAVSGTYGNRPSQGLMNLERVVALGDATDTAGVFCRDPRKWVHFAKAWYTPELHQSPNITGLPVLDVPDNTLWPKRILYPIEYLPLANPAAEELLQDFIRKMSQIFDMKIEKFNFSAVYESGNDFDDLLNVMKIINSYHQWRTVAKPLITAWAKLFDGRFPRVDVPWRDIWKNYDEDATDEDAHRSALSKRAKSVAWSETNFLYSTNESCSESIMIEDVGTGGLPLFRERDLMINNTAATLLTVLPRGAIMHQVTICPALACVDYTLPIGQVPYYSNVTFHTEYLPVTVNLMVKRGCDFMLFNMVDKLAEEGVLKTVKTGRTAF